MDPYGILAERPGIEREKIARGGGALRERIRSVENQKKKKGGLIAGGKVGDAFRSVFEKSCESFKCGNCPRLFLRFPRRKNGALLKLLKVPATGLCTRGCSGETRPFSPSAPGWGSLEQSPGKYAKSGTGGARGSAKKTPMSPEYSPRGAPKNTGGKDFAPRTWGGGSGG